MIVNENEKCIDGVDVDDCAGSMLGFASDFGLDHNDCLFLEGNELLDRCVDTFVWYLLYLEE